MKIVSFFICVILVIGCSKNEFIPSAFPSESAQMLSSVKSSHLNNDDLALIDGLIQIRISKEEAVKRGVSALEYDHLKEVLIKHNEGTAALLKGKRKEHAQTKSLNNNIIEWGMLQDPVNNFTNYAALLLGVSGESDGGILIHYSFASDYPENASHTLDYNAPGYFGGTGEISEQGTTDGNVPIPGFTSGWLYLNYSFSGFGQGLCVYQIIDNS